MCLLSPGRGRATFVGRASYHPEQRFLSKLCGSSQRIEHEYCRDLLGKSYLPKPRNTVSIINSKGEVVLDYSKVFICDFGVEELSKPKPDPSKIGCDVHYSPGDSFGVCTLTNAQGSVKVGAMICAD